MSELPPREPPDLRNRGQSNSYPPANPQQYPPQPSSGNYPPQDPLAPPSYPPQQYPPPQQQQPPSLGGYPPPQQPPTLRGTAPLPPYNQPMNPTPSKKLGEGSNGFMDSFHEHRIEYLAWGSVTLLIGFGIILLAIDTEFTQDLLLIAGPLTIGAILLFSSFLQRIVFGYAVSLFTWGAAVITSAFGLTQLIAALTETRGTENLQNQVLYFFGLLVIISGMVVILQVFRRPQD